MVIKKSIIETMLQAGKAPPVIPGIPKEHIAVLMMKYYHPLMQQNRKKEAQMALLSAFVKYNMGHVTVEDRADEYCVVEK